MRNLNITKCNVAIDRLLEVTTNSGHPYILMSYARHRHLEFSGNYEDVLTDHMMADHMISSGERSMPPSIGLKISAVTCGRSAVVSPTAFASSTGSFFLQVVRVRSAHAPRQLPTRTRRRISPLVGRNAFTRATIDSFFVNLPVRKFQVVRGIDLRVPRPATAGCPTRIARRERQTRFCRPNPQVMPGGKFIRRWHCAPMSKLPCQLATASGRQTSMKRFW